MKEELRGQREKNKFNLKNILLALRIVQLHIHIYNGKFCHIKEIRLVFKSKHKIKLTLQQK